MVLQIRITIVFFCIPCILLKMLIIGTVLEKKDKFALPLVTSTSLIYDIYIMRIKFDIILCNHSELLE